MAQPVDVSAAIFAMRARVNCHCSECRRSASAFCLSVEVRRAGLRVLTGEHAWSRSTHSGRRLKCFSCPQCGSCLSHQSDPPGERVRLNAGPLDVQVDVSPAIHIWTSRPLPGVIIPSDARQSLHEPGDSLIEER
ncbi:MAG: GFA family protein [Alphaproteobacteria bacterium]|nr:GFA family protein [Alphaproteobacteria bacterium]